ncbi:UDP-N-acetylglucosamine 2-epimerase [Fundidesulfovibrio agrisoli]|uniref:UDP-N-acetylglucosamine 2-epimerase n=1 Tax=Fundidesulfovibrio agrisoli TaxID=2922717 RepID=UPI001FABAE9C
MNAAKHTVCVFTGTRADYGLLKPLLEALRADPDCALRLLVSGSHLSPAHGMTVSEIRADGFEPDECVEMLGEADSPEAVCAGMGLALAGYGPALGRLAPDLLVVLGDRYEALCAAAAAVVMGVPVAHIAGGELTYGATDDAFRHAITKLSRLHFVSAEPYRRRVIQMGEHPDTVFTTGDPGLDGLRPESLLTRAEVAKTLDIGENQPFLLVTFHPVTQEGHSSAAQCEALLDALEALPELAPDLAVVFTGVNADAHGREHARLIAERVAAHPANWRHFASLGRLRYLSAMRCCLAVAGNSSSGLLESPSMGVPAVDIGNRQLGRIRPENVIHCEPERTQIESALRRATSPEMRELARNVQNPYHREGGVALMLAAMKAWLAAPRGFKTFHDL